MTATAAPASPIAYEVAGQPTCAACVAEALTITANPNVAAELVAKPLDANDVERWNPDGGSASSPSFMSLRPRRKS